jgi:hypothetical protein
VAAQSDVITTPKGLTLSPLRSELNIAPGTSLDGILKVTNSTNKPMAVDFNAEEFSVIDQQYDYAFTAESDIAKWVTFTPNEATLAAGKSKKITYSIGVPLSAEPGGRYISLFVSTNTGLTSDGVESRQRVASLLYITVLGDISRSGHLVSLSSPWLIGGESTWTAVLQNTGTTHYRSRYNLQVKDLLWGGTAASMSGEALILPGTVRLISNTLPAPFWPGIYKNIYTIGLGDTPAATKTLLILYIPTWAAILIVVIVVCLVFWLLQKRLAKKAS